LQNADETLKEVVWGQCGSFADVSIVCIKHLWRRRLPATSVPMVDPRKVPQKDSEELHRSGGGVGPGPAGRTEASGQQRDSVAIVTTRR